VDSVIHLAAETHVDRSIASPAAFVDTNIVGTFHLLETVLDYWRGLDEASRKLFRFHHVSTDEVFGDVPYDHEGFTSVMHYRPSSPYSASKAASEHLSNAWHRTYGLPVIISNSSNNYGPFQVPDKLVPLTILNAIQERRIPVYGTGTNVRDWLYIEDHVRALDLVLRRGHVGHSYQIGARGARTNLEVVRAICRILDDLRPRPNGRSHYELIEFVPDRPGHDRRYAIDPRKAESELGWTPNETFETGLAKTIDWYLEHRDWVASAS
jgi:dTDP-glucose 4,6-dehydratase